MFSKPNGLGGNNVPYKGSYEIIPGTSDIIIPKNTILKQQLTIKGDSNLLSYNIRDSIDIFNVTGNVTAKQLEDYSWTEINDIVSQGLQESMFNLHDTKTFTVGSETLTAEIADFNHDDLSDGTGKAGITFILKDCMNTKYYMNNGSTSTNTTGWPESDMYSYLNTTIYNQLPSELQSVIKPVNKITSKGNKSTTLQTSSDKLWLMSEQEVYSEQSYVIVSVNGEGTGYPIFVDSNSRIKKVDGVASHYWLRSPARNSDQHFCYIPDIGTYGTGTAYNGYGVAFGFCI